MEYKMQTWKLRVEGEFDNEKEAIKSLADSYMSCSKCDLPGDHAVEHLTGQSYRTLDNIAKRVYFYLKEKNKYGYLEWQLVYVLNIKPFKKDHWWPSEGLEIPKYRRFKYEIIKPEEANK